MRQQYQLLPYFATLGFAIVFVQALMLGYDTAGMKGVFIAGAIAYIPLGLIVGLVWSPPLLILSGLAGIPAWLFIYALYRWSIVAALTTTVEHIPVVLEPLSVSLFVFIGGWIGRKLFALRKRFSNISPSAQS